jgi:hypothetical protein
VELGPVGLTSGSWTDTGWDLEQVLDTRRCGADEHDLVANQRAVEPAGEQLGNRQTRQLREVPPEIEDELIAAVVGVHIAAEIRVKGRHGDPPQSNELRSVGIRRERDAFVLQIAEGELEREGQVGLVVFVPQDQQAASHDAVGILDHVAEAHLAAVVEKRRRCHRGESRVRELLDHHDSRIPGDHLAKLVPARAHGSIPVDVDADRARAVALQRGDGVGQDAIRKRMPELPDLVLVDPDQHDAGVPGRSRGQPVQELVVGAELPGDHPAGRASAEDDREHQESDHQRDGWSGADPQDSRSQPSEHRATASY